MRKTFITIPSLFLPISALGPKGKFIIGKNYLSILFVAIVSLLLITAKTSGATWLTEAIDVESDGYVGSTRSIAIDSLGKVHISYHGDDTLKYATNVSGSWVIEMVEETGGSASIAIDSSGKAHIIFPGQPKEQAEALKDILMNFPVQSVATGGAESDE